VTLEKYHVAPPTELKEEVRLKIMKAPVHSMGLDYQGIVAYGFQEGEEALVAVTDAPGVPVLIKTVFVLEVDDKRIEFSNLFGHRAPPVVPAYIDERQDPFALAIEMAYDQYLPTGIGPPDEFTSLLRKGRYPAKPRRIRTDKDNRVVRHHCPRGSLALGRTELLPCPFPMAHDERKRALLLK